MSIEKFKYKIFFNFFKKKKKLLWTLINNLLTNCVSAPIISVLNLSQDTILGKKKEKKIPIGVIRPKIRVKNEISRFLKFLSSSTSRLALLDLAPDSSSCAAQLLRAYFRSKRAKREVYELDPPLLGPQPRILGRSI